MQGPTGAHRGAEGDPTSARAANICEEVGYQGLGGQGGKLGMTLHEGRFVGGRQGSGEMELAIEIKPGGGKTTTKRGAAGDGGRV